MIAAPNRRFVLPLAGAAAVSMSAFASPSAAEPLPLADTAPPFEPRAVDAPPPPIAVDTLDVRIGAAGVIAHDRRAATCALLASVCGASPYTQDLGLGVVDFPIDFAYGLASWLAVEARVDVRLLDSALSFTSPSGASIAAPAGVHPKSEVQAGPGDLWAIARLAAQRGAFVVSSRFGTTIPIGKTEPSAAQIAAEGKSTEHLQFGSGTFRPIVGGSVKWIGSALELEASAFALFSFYANDREYRAPTELYTALRATYPLARARVRPYVALELPAVAAATWFGVPSFDEPAHAEVCAGGGVAWRFAEAWSVDAGLRARVASLIPSSGYTYPGTLTLGLTGEIDVAAATRAP